MDLSVVQRSTEENLTDTRPKFSFSVASLLASRGIQLRPPSPPTSLKDEQEEQEEQEEEQDEQYDEQDSDISVDDEQDEQDQQDALERRLSPGGASPPRLAMPTPLPGGRFPIPLPPHLQGLGLPPGWPGLLHTSLSSLNTGLFKSGKKNYCIFYKMIKFMEMFKTINI